MNSRLVIGFLLLVIAGLCGMVWYQAQPVPQPQQTPTENWSATSTTPVVQEPAPDSASPLSSRVVVSAPKHGATVPGKFTITGTAPGPWYFEASFPIIVTDAGGTKIATSHAQAQGDWMTEKDVPFTASVDVGSYHGPATVNLLKDNPSGLPENDDSTSFSIIIQ